MLACAHARSTFTLHTVKLPCAIRLTNTHISHGGSEGCRGGGGGAINHPPVHLWMSKNQAHRQSRTVVRHGGGLEGKTGEGGNTPISLTDIFLNLTCHVLRCRKQDESALEDAGARHGICHPAAGGRSRVT